MRFALAVPSLIFINLDECRYKCECGEEADYMIAAGIGRLHLAASSQALAGVRFFVIRKLQPRRPRSRSRGGFG
jgi:hypothetical protein